MDSFRRVFSIETFKENVSVFAEPRGLVRILQFVFAIFAYATACRGGSSAMISVNGNQSIYASWDYPYALADSAIMLTANNSRLNAISDSNTIKPSAEFFVFTGVTAMILSLVWCILYVMIARLYRENKMIPFVDLILTAIWSIFWIAGSSAWAKGISDLRSQTSWENIAQRSGLCSDMSQCIALSSGVYASVIVSVIFGFLNVILWVGSSWFVFKETSFFANRQPPVQQQQSSFANTATMPSQYETQVQSPSFHR